MDQMESEDDLEFTISPQIIHPVCYLCWQDILDSQTFQRCSELFCTNILHDNCADSPGFSCHVQYNF